MLKNSEKNGTDEIGLVTPTPGLYIAYKTGSFIITEMKGLLPHATSLFSWRKLSNTVSKVIVIE